MIVHRSIAFADKEFAGSLNTTRGIRPVRYQRLPLIALAKAAPDERRDGIITMTTTARRRYSQL
jgi:hypothetical protein